MPDAVPAILDCLQAFGLNWDGEVYYQSRHQAAYASAIAQLQEQSLIYPCVCSRKLLSGYPAVYPGFCREKHRPDEHHSLRVKTDDVEICFVDGCQGRICENMARQHGDFIVKRRDGLIAYQLAVVIDDYCQQITHVVRGCDLLDSTPKQIFLQKLLNLPMPEYLHIPVIADQHGNKLSKQTRAQAVDRKHPSATLFLLLKLLKQNPPASLGSASIHGILDWAINHWQPEPLTNIHTISLIFD